MLKVNCWVARSVQGIANRFHGLITYLRIVKYHEECVAGNGEQFQSTVFEQMVPQVDRLDLVEGPRVGDRRVEVSLLCGAGLLSEEVLKTHVRPAFENNRH